MNNWKITIVVAILGILILSSMSLGSAFATSSAPATFSLNVPMGQFIPDQQAKSDWGAFPVDIGKWFSASWGVNPAYGVGAVAYPYQYVYGNAYQSGISVTEDVIVQLTINWTVAVHYASLNGTHLGAPQWGWLGTYSDQLSLGEGQYPVKVEIIQGGKVLNTENVTTAFLGGGSSTFTVPAFVDPQPIANGSFYIVFLTALFTPTGIGLDTFLGYIPIYIGHGDFKPVVARIVGNPTDVVKGTGQASVEWAFSAGNWNVKFVYFKDGMANDTRPSNIEVMQWNNFTYVETGGLKILTYNFTSANLIGIYAWIFSETVTGYGKHFVVYDKGNAPVPEVIIWISPGTQEDNETVSIISIQNSSPYINLQVVIWYGNDINLVPSPTMAGVVEYFTPYNVSSGQNKSISFTNSMNGELNVEVLSKNAQGQSNNSFAMQRIKNQSVVTPPPPFHGNTTWFPVSPFSSTFNELFLLGGVGLFAYSAYDSSRNSAQRKMSMFSRRGQGPGFYFPTHYAAAIFLIILSLVNWIAIYQNVLNVANPLKGIPFISPFLIGVFLLSILLGGIQ